MSLEAFWGSLLLVAVSEMGDKTQLLAFSLAARYKKPVPILSGILVATLTNHALAAQVGQSISARVPPETLAWILGISFIAFGFWSLKPDTYNEETKLPRFGVFATTVILFFLAEMGDKTQLATVALGAKYALPWVVTAGTTAGMMLADGAAVFAGHRLASSTSMPLLRRLAAALFFIFGTLSIFAAQSRGGH